MSNSSTLTVLGELCSSPGGGNAVLTISGDESEPPNQLNYGSICDNANIDFDNDIVLPIELLSFGSIVHPDHVELLWVTASELNNDYFTLERSVNLYHWDILGYVQGAGTINEIQKYHFNDYTPVNVVAYYRLKQTDFDGQFEYFEPIAVRHETLANHKDFTVLKNGNTWTITMEGDERFLAEVYSLNGIKLFMGAGVGTLDFPDPGRAVVIRVLTSDNKALSRIIIK